jgi:hypothetical protein
MNFDGTIPLWGVISLVAPPIAGLIWMVITLHFHIKAIVKEQEHLKDQVKQAQDDIWVVQTAVNSDIKQIQNNISEMNRSLHEMNTYLKLLLDGKIQIEKTER